MGSSEFDSGAAVDGAACKAASMASKAEEEDGGDGGGAAGVFSSR
jgi:hypothetical protein